MREERTRKEILGRWRGCRRELAAAANDLSNLVPLLHRHGEKPAPAGRNEAPVDLILTVKDTYDLLVPCVNSIFANTDVPFRLFLNDNASGDSRTPQFLREVRDKHPDQVTLFLQERDLGVTDAVNLMFARTTNDVVYVNADTEMPPGWASRLLWPMRHSGEKVAAASPFTNASGWCSFPDIHLENELFAGMTVDELDGVFQRQRPTPLVELPYAPGFCMAISRRALDEVGFFDAEAFRPGYGDEADWCYRARVLGYKSVLVPNLFVYHKHSATFKRNPSLGRDRLIAERMEILRRRHPSYDNDSMDILDDPAFAARRSFMILLAAAEFVGATVVFTSDDRPNHIDFPEFDGESALVLLIRRDPESGTHRLDYRFREHRGSFTGPGLNWVVKLLYRIRINDIVIDDFSGWCDATVRNLRTVARLGKNGGARVSLILNDYLPLCPAFRLLGTQARFCGLPEDPGVCRDCLQKAEKSLDYPKWPGEYHSLKSYYWPTAEDRIAWDATPPEGFGQWRERLWGKFLREGVDRIYALSPTGRNHLLRVYPDLKDRVLPTPLGAPIFAEPAPDPLRRGGGRTTIAVIGDVDVYGGRNILHELADLLDERGVRADIVVFGRMDRPHPRIGGVDVSTARELPALLRREGVAVVLSPALWPRPDATATRLALALDLPLIAFAVNADGGGAASRGKSGAVVEIGAESLFEALKELMR